MKVALLGAPGAGKTTVAKRLAAALNREERLRYEAEHPDEQKRKSGSATWKVIDGYVEHLAHRTGCLYGHNGDYSHNLQVMAERWTLEAEALNKGYSTITCGSIYETILYSSLKEFMPITEQEIVMGRDYMQTTMRFFGWMENQTYNYNELFYL